MSHVATKFSYFLVFMALMVGTAVTVAVTYVDLGSLNIIVALAIAVTKATLVVLYFMHLKYSPKIIKVTFGAAFFFFAILVVHTLTDYLTRGTLGQPPFPPSGITIRPPRASCSVRARGGAAAAAVTRMRSNGAWSLQPREPSPTLMSTS